jgi:hypothetical protein
MGQSMAESNKSVADGYKSAFIGGVVGAVATALVTGAFAFLAYGGTAVTGFFINQTAGALLDHMQVRLREGGSKNSSDFDAKCEEHEIPVGGLCYITAENGALQNAGTTQDGYSCTYSRRADPSVKARIFAA